MTSELTLREKRWRWKAKEHNISTLGFPLLGPLMDSLFLASFRTSYGFPLSESLLPLLGPLIGFSLCTLYIVFHVIEV